MMRKSVARASRRLMSTSAAQRRVVVVDGCRIPFMPSGGAYNNYLGQQLLLFAMKGLLTRTGMDLNLPDYVIGGTVIQEVRTSNIAREAALGAGLPDSIPAHTVTMACISANQAIATGAQMIMAGQADTVIAGGVETMSDVPIRFSRKVRQAMLASRKVRHPSGYLKLIQKLGLKDLAPEAPAIAEFSSGEVMGHSSDRLAATWGISREAQDEFAALSHRNAAAGHASGKLKEEIVAVDGETMDLGVRGDSSVEKLSKLKPAFIKPHGTHTAANSSYLTDGAAVTLIMSEEKALAEGFKPKAVIKDYMFVSQDPKDELLLGPAYAVSKLMHRNGLKESDVGAFELHEAFAGQVLANIAALDSQKFASERAGVPQKVGALDMAKVNPYGGSLSIGHPFGATGSRIVNTAANRLHWEDKNLAVLAACAAGGQGHAMLLERL